MHRQPRVRPPRSATRPRVSATCVLLVLGRARAPTCIIAPLTGRRTPYPRRARAPPNATHRLKVATCARLGSLSAAVPCCRTATRRILAGRASSTARTPGLAMRHRISAMLLPLRMEARTPARPMPLHLPRTGPTWNRRRPGPPRRVNAIHPPRPPARGEFAATRSRRARLVRGSRSIEFGNEVIPANSGFEEHE